LGKSQTLLASLPSGQALEASALIYQDPIAMTALRLREIAPEMAESLAQISRGATPAVVCVYGEESSIREASSSGAYDLGAALVVAAIAIPNLLRSRIAANEASAVGSVRTVNTAQVTYEAVYPQRGYAPDLATLGTDPHGPVAGSQGHAGLISETLANESCSGGAWCTKSGYRFTVRSICKQHLCEEYVVVATPVDSNTGKRNFCSTSDAIVRYKPGSPLASSLGVAECKAWSPLH
jgi:type IV pilus assembly protein PilA